MYMEWRIKMVANKCKKNCFKIDFKLILSTCKNTNNYFNKSFIEYRKLSSTKLLRNKQIEPCQFSFSKTVKKKNNG